MMGGFCWAIGGGILYVLSPPIFPHPLASQFLRYKSLYALFLHCGREWLGGGGGREGRVNSLVSFTPGGQAQGEDYSIV